MRLLVLTTETLHHAQFVRALVGPEIDVLAMVETKPVSRPYETSHPFEAARDDFERGIWFAGRDARIADYAATETFPDINQTEAVDRLRAFSPDLIVSFGTGLLREKVIAAGGDRLLNLHGGDPERYRGLDTHLWAIWHKDFGALVTCLHRVSPGLDEGDIVTMSPVRVSPGMELHQLRAANTNVCVDLTLATIAQLRCNRQPLSHPQRGSGRYYGAMPTALKGVCVRRFERYTSGLV